MNDFEKTFEELGLDRSLVALIMNVNRSSLIKWFSEQQGTTPYQKPSASTITLIKLLQFLKERDEKLFAEFAVLQDFQVPPEIYLKDPEYWKGYVWTKHKVKPVLLEYLEGLEKKGKI